MTLDEQIKLFESNAEFARKDGDLQGCLNFRQLVEWLKDYKRLLGAIENIKIEIIAPNEMDSFENSNIWQKWFLDLLNKHIYRKEKVNESNN